MAYKLIHFLFLLQETYIYDWIFMILEIVRWENVLLYFSDDILRVE